jgi:hypothetical protein
MMHRIAKIPIMTKTEATAYAGIQRFVKGERKSKSGMTAPAMSSTPRKRKLKGPFKSIKATRYASVVEVRRTERSMPIKMRSKAILATRNFPRA